MPTETLNASFGNGIAIPAGQSLSTFGYNGGGYVNLVGYLVPAADVHAAGTADALAQNVGGLKPPKSIWRR